VTLLRNAKAVQCGPRRPAPVTEVVAEIAGERQTFPGDIARALYSIRQYHD